jgi:hypothetical protein
VGIGSSPDDVTGYSALLYWFKTAELCTQFFRDNIA